MRFEEWNIRWTRVAVQLSSWCRFRAVLLAGFVRLLLEVGLIQMILVRFVTVKCALFFSVEIAAWNAECMLNANDVVGFNNNLRDWSHTGVLKAENYWSELRCRKIRNIKRTFKWSPSQASVHVICTVHLQSRFMLDRETEKAYYPIIRYLLRQLNCCYYDYYRLAWETYSDHNVFALFFEHISFYRLNFVSSLLCRMPRHTEVKLGR